MRIQFLEREHPKKPSKKTQRRKLRDAAKTWRELQPKICPVCCINPSEEEHHIIAKGMGGNLDAECDENRILICGECHRGFHAAHIPLACILRAKRDVDVLDLVKLRQIAGHRHVPELVVGSEQPA